MARCRHLFHPLPECAPSPHDVENFCLIPVNFHRAGPKKISRRVQIHKLCFHFFSLKVVPNLCAKSLCGADTPVREPLNHVGAGVFPSAPFRMYSHQPSQVQKQKAQPTLCLLHEPNFSYPISYSIIPARAISAFTAILCSTLSACKVLSRTAASTRSSSFPFFASRLLASGESVFLASCAACAFNSPFVFSSAASRSCNSFVFLSSAGTTTRSSTAATMRSTFAFIASCCASSRSKTRSSVSAAFANRSAVVTNCCVICSSISSPFLNVHPKIDLFKSFMNTVIMNKLL